MVEHSVELKQKAGFTTVIEKSDNGADRRKSISYWVAKDAVCTKNRKES